MFRSLLFALIVAFAFADEVCYNQVGCFNDNEPFGHFPLPQDPNGKIAPSYWLHRAGQAARVIHDPQELAQEAIFLVHGFSESYNSSQRWAKDMVANLHVVKPEADVIFVDWSRGAVPGTGWRIYLQAASNTRAIGAAIAAFIDSNPKVNAANYHCIGFSLGAQVCGFAGKRLHRRWGRLSGIEPAGPAFSNKNDLTSRMAVGDGDFVDVIHTSMVGVYFAVGDSDFWLNNAKQQPGCKDFSDNEGWGEDVSQFFSCSHLIAPLIYTETIIPPNDCEFLYCPCSSWMMVQMGFCQTCSANKGALLGWKSNLSKNRGEFYGKTVEDQPYCKPQGSKVKQQQPASNGRFNQF